MPTYNRDYIIGESITSLLQQSFTNWELVVVDDGSTDNTRRLFEEIFSTDARIRYYETENSGAADSRNYGVSRAHAAYITFLDSDDIAASNWLESLVGMIKEGGQIVSCGITRTTPKQDYYQVPGNMGPAFHNFTMKFTHGGSYAMPKYIFEEVGGFDPNVRAGQHSELGIRVANFCKNHDTKFRKISTSLITVRHGREDHIRTNDRSVYEGATYFLAKHSENLSLDSRLHWNYKSVQLVRGRHLSRWDRLKIGADVVRLNPLSPMSYYRFFKYGILKSVFSKLPLL